MADVRPVAPGGPGCGVEADSDVRVRLDDAVLIGYRWTGSDNSNKPSMVLLHAAVCDSRSWNEVVPRLADVASVVTYDRRGFGRSAPSAAPFSHLEDLFAVVDATIGGPVRLVGSSAGGGLALEAALSAPERVAGLVLLAPGVSGRPSSMRWTPQPSACRHRRRRAGCRGRR